VSVYRGDVINKKTALDTAMKASEMTAARTRSASEKTARALQAVHRMFPHLNQTRFHQISDFYTLVILVSKLQTSGLILTDSKRNKLAWDLLVALSTGVDKLRERQKKLLPQRSDSELYRDYLLTVLEGTDEISKRQRREEILRGLIENLFHKKDEQRVFSPEQRRILWNISQDRRCARCKKPMTWGDLSLDHVNPHSKGGRTALENAALMHRRCNASKGNRLAA
jgi:5-methylcytosine-specific restriction endonuclease McrA